MYFKIIKKKRRQMGQNPKNKLYKFRALNKYTLDILEKNRLYVSDFEKLNDSMEGLFFYCSKQEKLSDKMREEKLEYKICSLSTTNKEPLLWAHYADNFKGICIKVQTNYNEENIDYVSKQTFLNNSTSAKKLLTQKTFHWKYEKEKRVLIKDNKNSKYIDIEIIAIYCGLRIEALEKKYSEKLLNIAREKKIKVYQTEISEKLNIINGKDIKILENNFKKKLRIKLNENSTFNVETLKNIYRKEVAKNYFFLEIWCEEFLEETSNADLSNSLNSFISKNNRKQ